MLFRSDTDTNSSEIIELFGDVVCQKVKWVSKSFDWKKISIENYISKILEDKDLIRNKSCDIFANSHCTFFNLFEKEKQRYLDQWLNVYSPITNELKIYYPKLFDLIINSIKYSQAHTPSLIQRKRIEKLAQIRNSQNI